MNLESTKLLFREEHPFQKRKNEADRILKKYPNRCPVIVEKSRNNNSLSEIDKHKFLVPNDLTLGQFSFVIRKRLKLQPQQAIFLFINRKILPTASLICQIYKNEKDKDGFLYVEYSGENCFGNQ